MLEKHSVEELRKKLIGKTATHPVRMNKPSEIDTVFEKGDEIWIMFKTGYPIVHKFPNTDKEVDLFLSYSNLEFSNADSLKDKETEEQKEELPLDSLTPNARLVLETSLGDKLENADNYKELTAEEVVRVYINEQDCTKEQIEEDVVSIYKHFKQ